MKTQFILHGKIFASQLQEANQFMLCRAKVTVCCEINTKKINTVWVEYMIFDY